MANFTSEIKRDLLRGVPKKRCCRLAMLSAFLNTSGTLGGTSGVSFTSESEEIAAYFLSLIEELFSVSMTVTEAVRDPKYGRNKLTFSYTGKGAEAMVQEIINHSAPNIFQSECCTSAYLKGAFLGGGSCTLPHGGAKTGYHLEFVFRSEEEGESFCELLESLDLIGRIIRRGDKAVVYIKSREGISDALNAMDAINGLKRLEELTALREESNRQNRLVNCFVNNTDKSAIASAKQMLVLERLKAKGVLDTLSPELQKTAQARLDHPALSLLELAGELGISKSCLNHRMRKLMERYGKEEL